MKEHLQGRRRIEGVTAALIVLLFQLSQTAFAQEPQTTVNAPELEISGVYQLLNDKLKESKGAALTTMGGRPGAAIYLPIWTWQTASGVPIAEFPAVGYRGVLGQSPGAFVTATLNLPGISNRIFNSAWFNAHVKRSKFPPIFFGPALLLPLNLHELKGLRIDEWEKHAAVILSVRIAGNK